MEFGLSEEQKILDDSVRGYLARVLPMEERRRIAAERDGFDETFAAGLAEQGIDGLLVPEEHGGAGLGIFECALVAEALGYAAGPAPFTGASVMAPMALRLAGDQEAQASLLPGIADGTRRLAVCAAAVSGTTDTAGFELAGDRLSGAASGVIDSGGATDVLIMLREGRFALVSSADANVEMTPRPSIDRTRPLADLRLDSAACRVLQASNDPTGVARRVIDAGRVMLAADTLGAAQCMLDQAVAYAGEREQFGRKIGSFQAVKHMCAEMVSMLEPCRSLVWYSAYAQDAIDEDAHVHACHAKAHLGEVGREVARMATEVHGGMGFTDLLGLHFWFKRIGFDRQVLGAPERCRTDAARAQGWLAA
jgi:alkylation response protein AidB-like acyl-CoA dehydrogenase